MRSLALLVAVVVTVAFSGQCKAHYLFLGVDGEGEHGRVNVYFEEGPQPGTGEYLDPFIERGTTWIRTIDSPDPVAIELEEVVTDAGRWLRGPLPVGQPRSIESVGTFGVYRYGQTDVLLHYRAKFIHVSNEEELQALSRAEDLDLDIAPSISEGRVVATVLWQGEPVNGREVLIRSRGLRLTLTTDAEGRIEFDATVPGDYIFRTSYDLPDGAGEFEGKEHQLTRYHSTLSVWLPLAE